MTEIWLQANRRAAIGPCLGMVVGTALVSIGAWAVGYSPMVPAIVGICFAPVTWHLLGRPRLRRRARSLLIDVGKSRLVEVPIEQIEGFLLGKGPAYLTGRDDKRTEATTLIVRISDRAPEFEKVETNVRVAAWCGHHVTLRGTWTEPLSVDLVNRLNQRLFDVQHASHAPEQVPS